MCKIHELTRAFVLRPHRLPESGSLLRSMAKEFEVWQIKYNGLLEIVFLQDGGFAVCLPSDFSREEMNGATRYFNRKLKTTPRMINLAQVAGFTPPRSN